ncbi:hypothetical protein MXB_3804, partial [Myxobolus squamalis]
MSSVYYTEPPNWGKVLIKTTIGDIEIDLWSRETPKSCKNFINLCLNKYYNGTIFHRVVKGFIVQGGDPSGTGDGGESFDGCPFADEFHQRIKFVRRGLVAMANGGINQNKSQFFITLGPCTDLNNKHTIFGSVVNNTIYNVLKVEELEIDVHDRPIIPPKILKTIVIENPFKDATLKQNNPKANADKYNDAFVHVKAIQNRKLLSFGDEDDETEIITKIKSSHDVLNDPSLSKQPAATVEDFSKDEMVDKVEKSVAAEDTPAILEPEENKREIYRRNLNTEQEELKEKLKATKRKVKMLQAESRTSFYQTQSILNEKRFFQSYIKTLEMLKSFENDLSQIQQKALIREQQRNEGKEIDLETETGWMNHLLTFDKPSPYISSALDANVEIADRYDITDPRNPINQRKGGLKPK